MWYYMVLYFSVIWVNRVPPCITFASKTNCAPAVRSRSASPTLQDWKIFYQSKLFFLQNLVHVSTVKGKLSTGALPST